MKRRDLCESAREIPPPSRISNANLTCEAHMRVSHVNLIWESLWAFSRSSFTWPRLWWNVNVRNVWFCGVYSVSKARIAKIHAFGPTLRVLQLQFRHDRGSFQIWSSRVNLISEVEIPCLSVSKTHDFGASRISTIWSVPIRQRTQLTGFSLSVENTPGLNKVHDPINNFSPASQETV